MQPSLRPLMISGAVLVVLALGLLTWERRTREQRQPPLPVLRETGEFVVTNQAGARLDAAALRGRPWAINLIFTRCPGPCADLTRLMRRVQDALPADSRAGLLSVTSDPEFDTPKVLAAYGERFGASTSRWHFVTGPLAEVRRLATEELLLVVQEKAEAQRATPEDLFLHSTLVILMDGKGRLRTAVEGLEAGAEQRILAALRQLEREE